VNQGAIRWGSSISRQLFDMNSRKPASSSQARSAGNRKGGDKTPPVAPTKAETAQFPPFAGLTLEDIHLPASRKACRSAVEEIFAAGKAGFDTEAKPTFRVGQKSDGPHLVQFALTSKAYLFQLHQSECEKAVSDLIKSETLLKVGFGLKNDRGQIRNRLGISLNQVLDLDQAFRKLGYRGQIGVRGAVGALLGQGFRKSKSITTSNWAASELRRSQLLYAANDAYAALKILEALEEQGLLER